MEPFFSICGIPTLTRSDQPETGAETRKRFEVLGQPRDDDGPVFPEPWQAQAFALAVKLHEAGHFTWKEWSEALGAEIAAARQRGEGDDGSRYYDHWLAALEGLMAAKGLLEPAALRHRKEAWAQAYRDTPHGKPVELHGHTRPWE